MSIKNYVYFFLGILFPSFVLVNANIEVISTNDFKNILFLAFFLLAISISINVVFYKIFKLYEGYAVAKKYGAIHFTSSWENRPKSKPIKINSEDKIAVQFLIDYKKIYISAFFMFINHLCFKHFFV